jgi:hypothetical protein
MLLPTPVTELQSMPVAVVKSSEEAQGVLGWGVPDGNNFTNGDVQGEARPLATAVNALECWNSPRENRWRVLSTFVSAFA